MRFGSKRTGSVSCRIPALLFAAVFMLMLPACGKKGPPVVPRKAALPAVTELRRQRIDDRLMLTWTLQTVNGQQRTDLAGFKVYRSRRGFSEPDCSSCPVLFERIADVPMNRPDAGPGSPGVFSFSDTLAEGYRYRYKVTIYTSAGEEGPASDTVDGVY